MAFLWLINGGDPTGMILQAVILAFQFAEDFLTSTSQIGLFPQVRVKMKNL